MRKNKPLDESRKTGQSSGTEMAFYSFLEKWLCMHWSSIEW
ncbi:hypothetical protein Hanom_Chr11g01038951 [Helianthus anomalus]